MHIVSNKTGVMITINEKGKEIKVCLLTKWQVRFDYKELNVATKKDLGSCSLTRSWTD